MRTLLLAAVIATLPMHAMAQTADTTPAPPEPAMPEAVAAENSGAVMAATAAGVVGGLVIAYFLPPGALVAAGNGVMAGLATAGAMMSQGMTSAGTAIGQGMTSAAGAVGRGTAAMGSWMGGGAAAPAAAAL